MFNGLCLCSAFILVVIILYFGLKMWIQLQDIPPLSSLESYDRGDPVQIFDRYDHLVCSFKGAENRKRVSFSQISPAMISATLAAEDHTFYEHHGVSFIGMARAFLANMHAGRVVEGGSTITQQLVKNLFFEQSHRTFERKIAEAFVASELERKYTKDQILEMYLNEAYFGNGAYGIEQAARYYFGKSATALRISESAYLAGLIKSPSRLSAPESRPLAVQQQLETIDRMVRYGFLAEQRAEQAKTEPLRFRFWQHAVIAGDQTVQKFPYYVSYVMDLVNHRYSPGEIRSQGLRIYTALDPAAQEAAERALQSGIAHAPAGCDQGALVTVAVKDGSVVALVGGAGDYVKQQWNCATHGHTAGSAFKPFVYLCAFEHQILTPESEVDDAPLTMKMADRSEWSPKNFDGKFMGTVTIREALAYSRNVCAVRVAQRVGMENIVDTARRAGIREQLDPNFSLALGSAAISPLELAGAYATFARDGLAIYPWVLRRIDNRNGHVVESFQQPAARAFAAEPVEQLAGILRDVVTSGTGQEANIPGLYVCGKTGTSDQAKDLWFVGYTPDLVTAVWGGNQQGKPVPGSHVTGGTVMAKIWKSYVSSIYDNKELVKNGLVRRTTVETRSAPLRPPTPAPRLEAPAAVQETPPAAPATKVLSAPDGSKIILQMQQGKLDTKQEQGEGESSSSSVKFKL
jgi:penicillin-binding protein 1A